MASTTIKKIGFIGLGIMGKPMARNLMKAGYELHIYARTPSKVDDVVAEGMIFHNTIAGCVRSSDAVITMVGFPPDVEEVYLGAGNIIESAAPGTYLIDMTTTSPTLAETISYEGEKRKLYVLDAPVTGGEIGAINGTLSILVGGNAEDYKACLPLFNAMGTNINYMGLAGSGQHTKLVNQIIIAGIISGVCEGLTYAKVKNLDLQTVYDAISTGAAACSQLNVYAPRIMKDDYAPGFMIKHFVKDMRIAREESENDHLNLDILRQALLNYEQLLADGHGDEGTQGLMRFYASGD